MKFPLLLLAAMSLQAAPWTWWVEPCSALVSKQSMCRAGDEELAKWAVEAWSKETGGKLEFKSSDEYSARLRFRWTRGHEGFYGQTRPTDNDGLRGAEIFVLTQVEAPQIASATKRDPILRDAIVYLTCVHEMGHALGLPHTNDFKDIMYDFANGGDIREYFLRYRKQLTTREDIRSHSALSAADSQALASHLPALQDPH